MMATTRRTKGAVGTVAAIEVDVLPFERGDRVRITEEYARVPELEAAMVGQDGIVTNPRNLAGYTEVRLYSGHTTLDKRNCWHFLAEELKKITVLDD